jgi:hypothetical protein
MTSIDDMAKRFTGMEEKIKPLQPLIDVVKKLAVQVTDQGQQQHALNLALLRLEHGDDAPLPQHEAGVASRTTHTNHTSIDGSAIPNRRRPPFEEVEDGGDFLPTYHKLDFTKFDGSSDPLPWLNRCEHYFRVHHTLEHKRVSYASFHLREDVQLWFHRLELNGGAPSWNCFVQLINTCFSPLGELTLLRRSGTVDEFCSKFMSLSYRGHTLTEPQQIQLFTTSLGEPLRTDVALQRPSSLDEAIMFARAYKQHSTTPTPPTPRSSQRTSAKSWTSASGGPQQSVVGSSAPAPSKSTTSRRLSSAEIADRRIKGLCFRCDEKYVPGHREECKHLFIIEVQIDDDDTPPPPANGDPTISIHALTGIQPRTSKTMQMQVSVGTTVLTALLDSSSTHNFIDVATTEGACIVFQGGTSLRVTVANIDRLSSPGCCSNVAIDIGDEPFSITCYGLALGSFDMVLGVQWLESSGLVLWDFQRHTMAFVRNGRCIIWTASESSTAPHVLAATSIDIMEELML